MPMVLVVDDSQDDAHHLAGLLSEHGCEVMLASGLDDARRRLAEVMPQLVVCAIGLPDNCGSALLGDLEEHPEVEVVLTTDRPSTETAIAAVRLGAFDYLVKPVAAAEVDRVLALIAGNGPETPERPPSGLSGKERPVGRLGDMVTVSPAMRRIFQRIERVAPTDVSVMVVGESGTGKEVVARAIHQLSSRREGPFLAVNCGAVAPSVIESELFGHERGSFTGADRRHQGYFERAHDGTLLLDEITEMSLDLQVKLLRVLETGEVVRVGGVKPVKASPRIIAATNREPEEAIVDGVLREDLYYRLRVFPIRVPTLRERGPREIELFAHHFLDELNREHATEKVLAPEALHHLSRHDWPGNVRELRNALRTAFVLSDHSIEPAALSLPPIPADAAVLDGTGPKVVIQVGESIAAAERRLILATLDHLDGNKRAAAQTLGISLKTLYNRLKSYRLHRV